MTDIIDTKKYFWLKLKDNFFDEKYIKALRRLPSGDSLVIVYLKMQLKSLKTNGLLQYEKLLPNAISELAMLLDEDESIVEFTINALIKFGVIEQWDNDTFYIKTMQQLIGSETASAERVRKHRALKALENAKNNNETLLCNTDVTKSNTYIDIEKDIYIDIEKEKEKFNKEKNTTTTRFKPPTLEEVAAYCNERNNNIDAEKFIDYYISNGWKVGKNPMKDWKATVRTWEKTSKQNNNYMQPQMPSFTRQIDVSKYDRED